MKQVRSSFVMPTLLLTIFLLIPNFVIAKVTGTCANCHTMHNSQEASPMALSGAGWNGSAGLSGTKTPDPQSHLTITDCVGCHTSMTADTIVTWKDSKIPIVYNKQVPTNPLAGGNFYWVEAAGFGDEYGHNVWGISDPDTLINQAPGNTHTCSNKGCHISLAKNPVES